MKHTIEVDIGLTGNGRSSPNNGQGTGDILILYEITKIISPIKGTKWVIALSNSMSNTPPDKIRATAQITVHTRNKIFLPILSMIIAQINMLINLATPKYKVEMNGSIVTPADLKR